MEIPGVTPEGVGGSVIALVMSFLGLKRLFSAEKVKAAVDETNVVATAAQTAIIENLQNELGRISASFGRVLKELEQSHNDNLRLREANIELLDKVSLLHNSLNQVKEQLSAYERVRRQCGGCKFDSPELIYKAEQS